MALNGTIAILEAQLIPKEELYKRWFGATHEEIAGHFNNDELHAYERHKGPINGIIWCKPGSVYYQDRHEYSNPGRYDYYDDSCDYFLLEDVVRCETEHPEYIGNVTPESLGLVQGESQGEIEGTPLHPGLETISANRAIKLLGITPIDMVDILNGMDTYDDYGNLIETRRLITTDEGRFRAHTYSEPYFTEGMLKSVKIYQLNFDQYCDEWGIQPSPKAEKADTSALESQLALAQKEIESLSQWNKFLHEQNKKLRPELAEKKSRIAELESQLASFAESKGKRDNSAATIGKLRKNLQRWKAALPLAVYATEKLLTHPAEATKKNRSELLSFICEVCPSKCTEPKIPCAVFSKEQFESWRDAVPLAHVDKSDKADKEDGLAYPLNTVETVEGEGDIEN